MDQIFSPDLFSRSMPSYQSVSDDTYEEIINIIKVHYSNLEFRKVTVKQLSGLEKNSKNYKLRIGSQTYALKCTNKREILPSFNEQLNISQILLGSGIIFPQIFRNDDEKFYSLHDDKIVWVLSEFINGNYFSGSSNQFLTLAHSIGTMQEKLDTIESLNLPVLDHKETWQKTSDVLSELLERKEEWDIIFPALEFKALNKEFDFFVDSLKKVTEFNNNSNACLAPTHIDIHPHNILFSDNNIPVILDVDSLQLADKTQSLAFATYKLAKQHVIYEGLKGSRKKIIKTTRNFLEILAQAAGIEETELVKFPLAATTEVLRRIAIIADLNMHENNREWNTVLHVHLSALHEIPIIFNMDLL